MGFPGTTLDKINIDAQTFASWGVDYLKFDGCSSNPIELMLGKSILTNWLKKRRFTMTSFLSHFKPTLLKYNMSQEMVD